MTAFVLDRLDAAQRLSSVRTSHIAADGAQLLADAGMLGWNVRTITVSASELTADGVTGFDLPKAAAPIYTDPATGVVRAIGGTVGRNYAPIQNEEMIPFLDALLETSGGKFNSAGYSPDHSSVFVGITTPSTLTIGGHDNVSVKMLVGNSHDGSGAFTARAELVRLVCTNGMTAAIPGTRMGITVRHTSGFREALAEARRSLDTISTYAESFKQAAEPMLTSEFVDAEFARIVERLLPVKAEDNPHVQGVLALRHNSNTIADDWRRTAWGAYQAFTEYTDHVMPVRTSGDRDLARATRTMGSAMTRAKTRMFTALQG